MTAAWVRPVDGAGIWHLSATHPRLRLTYLGTVVLCFLLLAAFLGAVAVGQRGVCAFDRRTHGHGVHQYCSDFSHNRTTP